MTNICSICYQEFILEKDSFRCSSCLNIEEDIQIKNNNSPQLSIEQLDIIASLKYNHVVVDAVAGSGKTTTVLGLATAFDEKMLMLTYNKSLKNEVIQKVRNKGLTNLQVENYHSLPLKLYPVNYSNGFDNQLIKLIEEDIAPKDNSRLDITYLIVDECQDQKKIYYRLIKKFIRDYELNNIKILLLGDKYQEVYGFLGADKRYLTNGKNTIPKLLPNNLLRIDIKKLSTSYRVTKQMAWFINNVVLKEERIVSIKNDEPVLWIRTNMICVSWNTYLGNFVSKITNGEILPEEIYVLTPSLTSKNKKCPFQTLENFLTSKKIPIYCDSEKGSYRSKNYDDLVANKVVFSTYHGVKGLERPYVILLGFEESYFNYYGRDYEKNVVPDPIYVALTRASKQLIIFENSKDSNLSFLNLNHDWNLQKNNCRRIGNHTDNILSLYECYYCRDFNMVKDVTDVISFLPSEFEYVIEEKLNSLFVKLLDPFHNTPIPSTIIFNELSENISSLNGLGIVTAWESIYGDGVTYVETNIAKYKKTNSKKKIPQLIRKELNKIPKRCKTYQDFLRISNVYKSINDDLIHNLAQITNYDWLTDEMVQPCHQILNTWLKDTSCIFEHAENKKHDYKCVCNKNRNINIRARFDIISNNDLWEIKVTHELDLSHKLQLLFYAWISDYKYDKYYLTNLRTGELWLLNVYDTTDMIDEIIEDILKFKYYSPSIKKLSDEEWLKQI